jgi:hypothetical protein
MLKGSGFSRRKAEAEEAEHYSNEVEVAVHSRGARSNYRSSWTIQDDVDLESALG